MGFKHNGAMTISHGNVKIKSVNNYVSARYWRLFQVGTEHYYGNYIKLSEIEGYTSVDCSGSNIFLNKNVISNWSGISGSMTYLTDGSTELFVENSTSQGAPVWVGIDLGSKQALRSLKIFIGTGWNYDYSHIYDEIDIEYSDDASNWTKLTTIYPNIIQSVPYWEEYLTLQ